MTPLASAVSTWHDRKYLKLDHVACRPEVATILFTGVGTSDRRVLPPYLLYYIFLGKSNNSPENKWSH